MFLHEISAEWGAQRIKGLSIWSTLTHALRKLLPGARAGLAQKDTQTSLIERFLYPKFGPGQVWDEAARRIRAGGGEILCGQHVDRILTDGWRVLAVETVDPATGRRQTFHGDYFFSTAPFRN